MATDLELMRCGFFLWDPGLEVFSCILDGINVVGKKSSQDTEFLYHLPQDCDKCSHHT